MYHRTFRSNVQLYGFIVSSEASQFGNSTHFAHRPRQSHIRIRAFKAQRLVVVLNVFFICVHFVVVIVVFYGHAATSFGITNFSRTIKCVFQQDVQNSITVSLDGVQSWTKISFFHKIVDYCDILAEWETPEELYLYFTILVHSCTKFFL